jgi:hypothetical protein
MKRHEVICEKLKKFGYASDRRIRMYGEELHIVSDPIADETGYCVLAVAIRSENLRHLRIPLSVVSMLERELEREKMAQMVA